jgi:hypothetical protein
MALVICSECGHQISDKAINCIKCGCPVNSKKEIVKCFECGVELAKDINTCSNCGAQQYQTKKYTTDKVESSLSKTSLSKPLLLLTLIISALIIYYKINSNNTGHSGADSLEINTYEEKVLTVEEMERAEPTDFLDADGTYRKNFFGTKIKVHGFIRNTATVATYKDAVVRITYYSKTRTALITKNYKIYDYFPPKSKKNFELKIENYKDVNSIGWEVVSASVK